MEADTYQEIQALSRLTVGQLREKYLDVFGEETRSRHKEFLRKRIAWRLQGEVVPASGKDPEGGTATDKFTVVLETAPSGPSHSARGHQDFSGSKPTHSSPGKRAELSAQRSPAG